MTPGKDRKASVLRASRRLWQKKATPFVLATVGVALLSTSMWRDGSSTIDDISSTLMGIRRLVAGDSEHYLAIADSLREGDFRMDHVEPTGGADRAHRQPGYPALLAVAGNLGAQGAPALARVDLGVLVASLWIAAVSATVATGSALAGLVAAAVIFDVHFLFDIATGRILTEPLYVAVAVGAVGACLSYLSRPATGSLLASAALAGLAYLVRVNGLFLAASLGLAMLTADLDRTRRSRSATAAGALPPHMPLANHAAALALFVLVTTPSWLPRIVYTGNPIYHGYLTNFLWVDDYARAHVPGPPRYTLSTYVEEHDAGDAVTRLSWGLQHVFWETPREKFGIVVATSLLIAVLILFALRDVPGMLIVAAAIFQAMPLAWTAIANPARRLPATALLPFVALVIAAAVAALVRRSHERNRT